MQQENIHRSLFANSVWSFKYTILFNNVLISPYRITFLIKTFFRYYGLTQFDLQGFSSLCKTNEFHKIIFYWIRESSWRVFYNLIEHYNLAYITWLNNLKSFTCLKCHIWQFSKNQSFWNFSSIDLWLSHNQNPIRKHVLSFILFF